MRSNDLLLHMAKSPPRLLRSRAFDSPPVTHLENWLKANIREATMELIKMVKFEGSASPPNASPDVAAPTIAELNSQ